MDDKKPDEPEAKMTDLPLVKCKGCGRDMFWGTTTEGKNIPLDPKPPIYGIIRRDVGPLRGKIEAYRAQDVFVSHFSVCPHASKFSGSRKKDQ